MVSAAFSLPPPSPTLIMHLHPYIPPPTTLTASLCTSIHTSHLLPLSLPPYAPPSIHPMQPKTFKEFWFVFRALDGGAKILEYHQNERKFLDCPAYPKGVLHIGSGQAVSYHNPEKKQQFSIELADQSIIFLEAATAQLAREWMACLNAVLFGKGTGRKYFIYRHH